MTEERQAEAERPIEPEDKEEAQNAGRESDSSEELVAEVTETETQTSLKDDERIDGTTEEAAEVAADESAKDASEVESEASLSPEAQLIQQLEADLAEAQAEALAQIDKRQRLAAEFQNSKKRQERQLSDAIRRAGEGIVTRLLPVLDDFDLAFGNVPEGIGEEEQAWVEGFQQIQIKVAGVLEDQGLTPIPRHGEFDPNLHEAITSEPNDDVESGHIIETLRVGYEYKGRVLRPAMVRVAS